MIKFVLTNTIFLIMIKSINEFTKIFLKNQNFEWRSKIFCFISIELNNLIFYKIKSIINSLIEINVNMFALKLKFKFELFENVKKLLINEIKLLIEKIK